MNNAKKSVFGRVLALMLVLLLMFQGMPPAAAVAGSAENSENTDFPEVSGSGPEARAESVYYVSFEDVTGSAFTGKTVKLQNPVSPRAVMLIGLAAGSWDGKSMTGDSYSDFADQAYPSVITNQKLDPYDVWSDAYLTGLVIDGKNIKNEGTNRWIVTVANEFGAAEYCSMSRATADFNTLRSRSVIRVIYTPDGGASLGAGNLAAGGALQPSKDSLVAAMAEAGTGHPAYAEAERVLLSTTADADAVAAAVTLFDRPTDADETAAAAVTELIRALPEAELLTLAHAEAVRTAEERYGALTDAQCSLVAQDAVRKLEAAGEKIAALRAEADQAAADAVKALIEAIPGTVTQEHRARIEGARAAYEKLTPEQKNLVANLKKLTAAEQALEQPQNPDNAPVGRVYFSAERFVIGQGFLTEPIVVDIYPGDRYAQIIDRGLNGAASIRDNGNYLQYIAGANLGRDHVKVPAYIETMSGGRFNTAKALEFYDMVGMDAWGAENLGEFTYSAQSGWMYCVDGDYPDLGIGQKIPVDGEVVRVQYTVYGLGMDVAGSAQVPVTNMDVLVKAMAMTNAESEVIRTEESVAKCYAQAVELMQDATCAPERVEELAEALLSALNQAKGNASGLVEQAIENLPAPEDVNNSHAAAIRDAAKAYDSLSDAQKAQVHNAEKLTAVREALEALEAADRLAAGEVDRLILALPEPITLDRKTQVEAARKAFDALTDAQKALVKNEQRLTDAEQTIRELEQGQPDPTDPVNPSDPTDPIGPTDPVKPESVEEIRDPASRVVLKGDGLTADMELAVSLLGRKDSDVKLMRKKIPSTEGLIRIYQVQLHTAGSSDEIAIAKGSTVELPVAPKYEGKELKILFCRDGKVETMKGKVENGVIKLKIDALGSFGLAVKVGSTNGGGDNLYTGDPTSVAGLTVTFAVSLAAVLVLLKKRRNMA